MLRVNRKILIGIIITCLILSLSSIYVAGMSVQEVISNMQKTYEKQMKGINDYTIVQKGTGGMAALAGEITIYYKKAEIKGEVIYKTRTESEVMGMAMVSIYDGNYNWSKNPMTGEIEKKISEFDPGKMWKNLGLTKTEYLGEEEIEGEKAYVLQVDNALQVMGSQQAMSPQGGQSEGSAESWGKLWINSKTWMPVRMLMVIKAKSEGGAKEMAMNTNMTTDLKDYRQAGTMLHPYQLVVNMAMEIDTSGLSEEEKKEQEQAMQMMQAMMSGMGSFSIDTVDIKVNTGLSDDLFDGSKLE
jgi:outer membrane lipoprotein-sorting protein